MTALVRLVARGLAGLWRDLSGVAAVEAALISPVAVVVLCIAIESGTFLYCEHQVLKGVRDAARYASRLPLSTWGCTSASGETDLSTANPAWQQIANVAVYGNVSGGTNPRLWSWSAKAADAEVQIRYSCDTVAANGVYSATAVAPKIAVVAKPNYPSLLKTMGGFGTNLTLFAREQAMGIGV